MCSPTWPPSFYYFQHDFERSELPPAWLTSTILPLFKKGERNQAGNYRPISITSSCCKVMESIIHDSMSSYLLSNDLISDSQHGFLKKRSTLSNLLYSIRHWLSSLNSGKSIDIIYVDFAKAFDSVSHTKLLHKLNSYGISGHPTLGFQPDFLVEPNLSSLVVLSLRPNLS